VNQVHGEEEGGACLAVPVGHDDFDTCLDLAEVATQVVLEIANPDLDST
jgi:hypothetical protein